MCSCGRMHSFEMQKMTTRTDQLLCITKVTGSKIYTTESEVETHGKAEALLFSLKQYHTHHYRFYKKGTTRAIVDLQGLPVSDAFWHSNFSAMVGLNTFCP